MKPKKRNLKQAFKDPDSEIDDRLAGYPSYPSGEDIYTKFQEEIEINPEDISTSKRNGDEEMTGEGHDSAIQGHMTATGLDIPGTDMDDYMEMIGSEDEENNFYSLGGDDHNDLEENQGDG